MIRRGTKVLFVSFVILWFIIPLLAGGLALAKGFDGLYGQDAFAYYDYATVDLARQLFPPPPFFWPPGYPLLIFGTSRVMGVTPLAGQLVSLMAGGLAVTFTALLTHDIAARLWGDKCAVWLAGIAAGLSLAMMGQLWQSSAVLMADTTGLAAAVMGLWAVVRYAIPTPNPAHNANPAKTTDFSRRGMIYHAPTNPIPSHERSKILYTGWGFLAFASGALAYAVITRYGYAPLAIACGVYVISHLLKYLTPRQMFIHAVFAAIPALLILAPVLIPALLPVETPTFGGNFGRQFASWDFANAFRRDFENPDGFFQFAQPNLVYYLHLIAQPYYFGAVLPIFALGGLWVLARQRMWGVLALLVGGFTGLILLLVGLPQQNVRFALAYMPMVAVGIGLGVGWVWEITSPPVPLSKHGEGGNQRFLSIRRAGVVLILAAALIFNGISAGRYTGEFIDRHTANLETVRWAEARMRADSEVIVFGLTATMAHYTGLPTHEIYSLTPDDLAAITSQGRRVYLLLDVYNVETQWLGRAPQVNYVWLRENAGLRQIGKRGHFTLFRVGE